MKLRNRKSNGASFSHTIERPSYGGIRGIRKLEYISVSRMTFSSCQVLRKSVN